MEGEEDNLELSSDSSSEVTIYESWKGERKEEKSEEQQDSTPIPEARLFDIEGFLREDYGVDQSAHDRPLLPIRQTKKVSSKAKQTGPMTTGASSEAPVPEDQC